jgi:two-component system, NarL family, nitrate/nitrite response regulator NarL
MARLRVALIEDHEVLSDAIRISLSNIEHDVAVVPLPDSPNHQAELVRDTIDTRPDVVLLDLDLGPAGDGAALIPQLREHGCRVVVMTGSWQEVRWGECLDLGALAVVAKGARLDAIAEAIRKACQGLPAMPPEERERLITLWRDHERARSNAHARLARLTQRETEVLAALVNGHRVSEIAQLSVVSEATVRTQVKSILAKLKVSSQIAAVALAHEAELSWDGSMSGRLPVQRRSGARNGR